MGKFQHYDIMLILRPPQGIKASSPKEALKEAASYFFAVPVERQDIKCVAITRVRELTPEEKEDWAS